MKFSIYILKKFSVKKVVWNLCSSNDRAFDRQSKGSGLDTQRSGSVPFFTENFFKIYIRNLMVESTIFDTKPEPLGISVSLKNMLLSITGFEKYHQEC